MIEWRLLFRQPDSSCPPFSNIINDQAHFQTSTTPPERLTTPVLPDI